MQEARLLWRDPVRDSCNIPSGNEFMTEVTDEKEMNLSSVVLVELTDLLID